MAEQRILVGTVKQLTRFLVKSMAGENMTEAKLGWHGLPGDRRYAVVKTDNSSGFPWLTARDWPEILLYKPYTKAVDGTPEPAVFIRTPAGRDLPVNSSELIKEISTRSGHRCHLLHHFGGVFDCSDLSIITTATIMGMSERVGGELDVRRFRPNIVIETTDEKPFPEDKWVGDLLIFGESGDLARVRVNRKDQRCMVVNLDPDTAKQDPKVLKEIVATRKNLAGVYSTTEHPGLVRVGDPVWLYRG